MGLMCKLFSHKWTGCKCERCGETRDEQHDWDFCKGRCKRCGKTQAEQHDWKNCKCTRCGKVRDERHDWDLCKGICKLCGKTQLGQHDWNGCKCKRCGETRDEQHKWDGCKCSQCSKIRDEQHDWDAIEGKCNHCRTGCEHLEWDGCKCKHCGFVKHNWGKYVEGLSISNNKCLICGDQFKYWYGNKYGAISQLHDLFVAKDTDGIKNLGLRLHELNDKDENLRFMREVGGGFASLYPRDASTLDYLWNGIGNWGKF